MSYISNLWIFFILLFGIIIIPGMDMIFVLTNSLHSGKKMGIAATLGIMCGGIFHAIIGFSLVIMAGSISPILFKSMLVIGSLYMIYIGFSLVKSNIFVDKIDGENAPNYAKSFRQGAITCILNPKAYAFVLAVYPNFLKPQYGSLLLQVIVMGLLTIFLQLLIYGSVALGAGHARDLLLGNKQITIWFSRFVGVIFLVIAIYNLSHAVFN